MSYKKIYQNHPLSSSGRQCISKCYAPNVVYTHPKTLDTIYNTLNNTCAVEPYDDPINNERIYTNKCEGIEIYESDSKLDMLTPYIDFDPRTFLDKIYGIINVPDFFTYIINNPNMPLLTYERLLDCFITTFGKNITLVDDPFTKMTHKLIKKYWIKIIYKKLGNYIECNEHECSVILAKDNKLNKHDFLHERVNFLMSVLTESVIYRMSNAFFSEINKSEQQSIGIDEFKKFIINTTESILTGMISS